jgi:uncharacterized iron-regulated membrane protein
MVISFSGVYMIFPQYVEPVVATFSPITLEVPAGLRSQPRIGMEPISATEAVAIAREALPHGELKFVLLPNGPRGYYVITMRQPGEVRKSGGDSRAFIDQYSGEVLKLQDWYEFTAGDTFLAWQFPLHNGEAFGLIGRWIVCFSGFVPLMLFITGILIWLRKRRARRSVSALNYSERVRAR